MSEAEGAGLRDVLVIGGGVAALVAARACAHVGLRVTVLEATDAVGGAVAGHEVAGMTLDSGAESFAVRRNTVAEFIDGLGLSGEVIAPNPAGAWLHLPANGSAPGSVSVPLPRAGVLGIPGSPLADDVRRVIGWGGAWRAYLDRLMPVLKIGREHSLGELVEKRMGRRVLDRLVEPVAGGVYSASAADLEVDLVAPGLNAALTTAGSLSGAVTAMRAAAPAGSAIGGLRGGMSRLVDALLADLDHYGVDVRTGSPVTALARTGGAVGSEKGSEAGSEQEPTWTVTLAAPAAPAAEGAAAALLGAATATGSTLEGRFVIIATPGAQALRLLAGVTPEALALAELDWPRPAAVELATIVIDAPALDEHPRGTGVLVGAGTPGVTAKALTHVSAKWAWVAEAAGPGRHVLRLSYGRAGQESPVAHLSDDDLRDLAVRDASALLGVDLDPAAVRGFARTVWGDALSPATIGAAGRVRRVRETLEAIPGIDITGAWLAGTGLASVIPDALAASSRVRHAALGL
ncbi:oxygen-dependent protoporphyrinogen oxidase [Cryobacterium psychrotolerans]|uniref:Oxygen-dependent protoporphyrinogen oxidase n=1 Tax=Cryobacterium psychrotolerans TaxID=386301 RepID=A0A1G9B3I3_9MICO|nr:MULTISPECIES: FAD-dependent oxidoreductase [Cryobacterium]TFD46301.1 FAD-dependent oxidoreductase [Cryobacterium sp. TMT1-2-1]TFD84603.1 FAD-dependent oxidoreductase [Cryobacterium psychrotolerans]SDK33540.1 oxygen-dependent protoporphyrinogen oxidase [Cryobacterium psychrotolerans]